MAPSAVTTANTALQVPSGDGPSKAVPTAPLLSAPGMTCGCCGVATTSRFVRLPTYTPPIRGLGAPLSGSPVGSRIEDEPTPVSPNGAFAGQMRPKALLLDRPRGLLTPVYEAVVALGLLTPLSQWGLFALNICTAPSRVEA